MKKKTQKRIIKLFRLPVWLDLLLTVFGVIIGIALTNLYEKNQLKTAHEQALILVWEEVRDNQVILSEFYNQLQNKFEATRIVDVHMDKNSRIFVHKDSINKFRNEVSSVFKIDSLTSYSDEMFRVRGTLEIKVGSSIFGGKLRNSVWNAFSRKQDFLSLTDFKTIADLEQIHGFQLELNTLTNKWKDNLFFDFTISEKEREKFFIEWFKLIGNQNVMLQIYNVNLTKIDSIN